jgi:nucleoside-diphosphate-sugar epimerase
MQLAFVTGGSGFLGRNLIAWLRERGVAVRALARSNASAEAVRAAGAEAARGDLSDAPGTLAALVRGADVVFHCAALAEDWADEEVAWAANVTGTEHVLAAANQAGVPRFVHVSTEAVLVGADPIVQVDETRPIPDAPLGVYPRTKAEAERRALAANRSDFAVMVVRPRFIWGEGDTTLLPRLVEGARTGALKWIGGGRYLTSTCHVKNVCEGMWKAAERGRGGEIYFLTDGAPIAFRDMITRMLESQGVAPPTASVPRWAAHAMAIATESVWRTLRLRGRPPLPHATFHLIGDEVTVRDDKARRELGYVGEVDREQGLREMARSRGEARA